MTSPDDFNPYARLAGELIEQATKEQLARGGAAPRAQHIGYYRARYGDVPQEELLSMFREETLDEETQELLLHGMKNLVSALGEVMGVEGEGVH